MTKKIYLLVGAPGSGKTWVTGQLGSKFHLIHHDGYIYLKKPGAYLEEVLKQAPHAKKPVLIEAPFSVSAIKDPLEKAGYQIEPIYICEDSKTHGERYFGREKKVIPQGHLTRTQTYLERAKAGRHFHGSSSEVLEHLKNIDVTPPAPFAAITNFIKNSKEPKEETIEAGPNAAEPSSP